MHPARPLNFLAAALAALLAADAIAQPVLGFREEFPGAGNMSTWAGGSVFGNPGTGGVLGDGDGFLSVETFLPANLGTVSFGAEYAGDWTAAGVTQVRLWLKDIGADEPLEIHFSIGTFGNFWQYNPAFLPPSDRWAEYVVNLANVADWTHIDNTVPGTFADALAAVDRVHVRHDNAPYTKTPDPLQGGFGLDHILLTNGTAGVEAGPGAVARAVELAPPSPNPSRGPVALTLTQFESGPATVEVLDVSGRSVRRVVLAAAGPGPRTWMWDGRDESGASVAPGVYRVRASGAAGGASRALVRVR